MKILLVYPEYPGTFWSFKYALPFISKKAFHPPLGLITVAAMLPHTWEKRLIDMNISSRRWDMRRLYGDIATYCRESIAHAHIMNGSSIFLRNIIRKFEGR